MPTPGAGPDVAQALVARQNREDRIRQRSSTAISDVQLIELDALSRRVADDVDSDVGTGKPDCNRIPSARRARVPLGSLCLRRLQEGRQRRSAFAVSCLQRWQPRSVLYTRPASPLPVNRSCRPPSRRSAKDLSSISSIARWSPALAARSSAQGIQSGGYRPSLIPSRIEQINRAVDTSLQLTIFTRGLVALLVALTIGASLPRANRARYSRRLARRTFNVCQIDSRRRHGRSGCIALRVYCRCALPDL